MQTPRTSEPFLHLHQPAGAPAMHKTYLHLTPSNARPVPHLSFPPIRERNQPCLLFCRELRYLFLRYGRNVFQKMYNVAEIIRKGHRHSEFPRV